MKGCIYSFINKKTGEILFQFEGEIDAAYIFIYKMDKNRLFSDERGLEHWLNRRAHYLLMGKTDYQIMKELDILEMSDHLGRMTDGQCLYAYLHHFELTEDDYAIYPAQNTIHACMFSDYRFYRIYQVSRYKGLLDRQSLSISHKEEYQK